MSRRPASTPPVERPPVEELSELTWARVERRLWAELDRAPSAAPAPLAARTDRRRWPWLAAVALAAAAVLAFVAWPSSGTRTMLPSTSRVATAASPTEVSFGDAAITVAPSSAVLLQGHVDRGVAIVLERGSATFSVAPRAGRPPFMVLAGAVQVRVIGTRFTVTRSGDDARVDVAHGEVEVVAWGRREVLLAGASWSSDGVREAAVGGSASVANPGGVAAAHFSPPMTGTSSATSPPVPVPAPAPAPAPRPRRGTDDDGGRDDATDAARPAPAPTTDAQDVRISDTPQARYEAAAALEPTDPARAQRLYAQLARGRDAWAANALYAAARLAEARGDLDVAVRYARAYLQRFPGGSNAALARALVARVTGASR